MTFGQFQNSGMDPAAAQTMSQSPQGEFQLAAATTGTSALDEAKRALLKARQALAHDDVSKATEMLKAASQSGADFKRIGDSPTTVQSLIDRQNQLVEMLQQKDRTFNASAASFLLSQAEALMFYQDFDTAEMLINKARSYPVEFNSAIGNPDQLAKMIEVARNNSAVAQAAAIVSPAPPSDKKTETFKLLAQAQLAIDQEKWNEAKYLVDQAKGLGVPADQFSDNEPQPWQLALTVQNGLNRPAFDSAVMQTGFVQAAPNNVVQANYDPAKDTTSNRTVSGTDAETNGPTFNRLPKSGQELYQLGLQALDNKNHQEARNYFERAWQSEGQLDPQIRQSVQDQLARLTVSGTATPNVLQASQSVGVDDGQSLQKQKFREVQSEVFRDRAAAERLLETNPREALEKMTMVRGRITQSQLDLASQKPLLAQVDRDLAEMQRYIDQNLPEILNDETNRDRLESVDLSRERRIDVETQLQRLTDDFNKLVDEQRFAEAIVVAQQAYALAPDMEITVALTEKAKLLSRVNHMQTIRDRREGTFWQTMADAEDTGHGLSTDVPMEMGDAQQWTRNTDRRLRNSEQSQYQTEADYRIWNTLKNQQVQGEYKGTLAEAMDQLSRQANLNIVFDDLALAAESVRKDQLVDVPIRTPISLRSALGVILQSAGLVFVVENEVIKVTSKSASQAKLVYKTIYIGDLVMPVNTPQHPMHMTFMQPNMAGAGGGVMNVTDTGTMGPQNQLTMAQQLGGNMPGNPFGNSYGGGGPQMGIPTTATVGGQPNGGITLQDFNPLIELIQNTIQPDTWQDTGTGLGTIEAFVPNLSLIVSQTQEIQDQIQDLLKKLRELNDVQIVVEVKFINLADNYFERIGVDFDFSVNDNSPANLDPNADNPLGGSTVIGRAPVDPFQPTNDLDLQFLQGSFGAATPLFGGFQQTTAANFGFAILSDIEVFFLIEASKGDQRTNITQAPTVTMFNGQSANVADQSQRPFVTSVIPVVGDFAVAHQPVITLLPDGTSLNVTAVVSDDRRFVRLALNPFFSQVTEVEPFTFDGRSTTERATGSVLDDLLDIVDGGANADDSDDELQTTNEGITIQLPVLSFTSVNTVVSVPDGGTVLLGGIKTMREGRSEAGVPFLSSVPYVNRLFKNVGIGHETTSLMLMVTPRILIQKEIEEDQVGVSSTN